MGAVEGALGAEGGPFFLGAELSLVDVVFSPFLERIVASIPYYKGEKLRGSPWGPYQIFQAKPLGQGVRICDCALSTSRPAVGVHITLFRT